MWINMYLVLEKNYSQIIINGNQVFVIHIPTSNHMSNNKMLYEL